MHAVVEDPRLRTFPFPTRRPTQAELVRCFHELTRLKLSHFTAEDLTQLDEAYRAALQPRKPIGQIPKPDLPKAPEIPKLSKEEMLDRDRWERVVDMAKKGKVEPLKAFLEKQRTEIAEADPKAWIGRLPDWMEDSRTSPTLLHVAASNDRPEFVRWLLIDMQVDPTMAAFSKPDNEYFGLPVRTAYECASSRGVRNVFRRAFADYPDTWNWLNDAHVPSQLTEEMEATQSAKKNERNSKLKEKLRERAVEREAEQIAELEKQRSQQEAETRRKDEAKMMSNSTTPKRLGGAAPKAILEQTQLKGLSEEAKMKIERERRARAAEARLQRP